MIQIKKRRELLIWFILSSLHLLLFMLVVFTSIFQNTPLEAFVMTSLVVCYILQHVGLPVLQNNGLSGGGWPVPNLFGWFISVGAWLVFYWLVAIGIERLTRRCIGSATPPTELGR